ncbi:hypothetical protein SACC_22850 [Saccharolobus caldissimus]|uniref:Uncharacterized protein n=1 Tax=Saccharolobus caldissimus TaxID=1702097 RepID=A0AAQ4CTY7_9CREN|nr:hypothetical protein SACC_22850 [Saccharolobus caldissimus]
MMEFIKALSYSSNKGGPIIILLNQMLINIKISINILDKTLL